MQRETPEREFDSPSKRQKGDHLESPEKISDKLSLPGRTGARVDDVAARTLFLAGFQTLSMGKSKETQEEGLKTIRRVLESQGIFPADVRLPSTPSDQPKLGIPIRVILGSIEDTRKAEAVFHIQYAALELCLTRKWPGPEISYRFHSEGRMSGRTARRQLGTVGLNFEGENAIRTINQMRDPTTGGKMTTCWMVFATPQGKTYFLDNIETVKKGMQDCTFPKPKN